jgi:hypothetical protein
MMWFKHHCIVCNKDYNIEFPYTEQEFSIRWDKWSRGELVQRAFPELSADQREAMQTGTCARCWNKIFPPED